MKRKIQVSLACVFGLTTVVAVYLGVVRGTAEQLLLLLLYGLAVFAWIVAPSASHILNVGLQRYGMSRGAGMVAEVFCLGIALVVALTNGWVYAGIRGAIGILASTLVFWGPQFAMRMIFQ